MTDNQSTIAGNYRGTGPVIECILDEGAPTVSDGAFGPEGLTMKVAVNSSSYNLEENQAVAISNDVLNTFVGTEGMPIVERAVNAEVLVMGTIVSKPKWNTMPPNTSAGDSLTKRLAGKYYRTALIEFHIAGKIVAAQVMCDGTNACVPGVGATLKANIAKMYTAGNDGYFFDSAASGGTGVIPLHYAPAGTDGDLYTVACLVCGMLTAVTGA
jgi:hypothetical protein